ncbi:MAG: ferrous iron transporter B [Gammaproteobacteria bacterium]|nr:ferrous iron transporter B [Gammaproteobacteria bacterium]
MTQPAGQAFELPVTTPVFRGPKHLRIALVGMPNSGKSTLFNAVSATSVSTGELTGSHQTYNECAVQIGFDEARVVSLPGIQSLTNLPHEDLVTLQYLLWGDLIPPVLAHEQTSPPAPFAPPDVIIQVVDATALDRHLELTIELSQLGKPMVLALNMMDEARKKGTHINSKTLSEKLGIPVVPTIALRGHGISELFTAAACAVREGEYPHPQPPSDYIVKALQPLKRALHQPELQKAFCVPYSFLLMQVAANDHYFLDELKQHFPQQLPALLELRTASEQSLPRSLGEELHADRHHRCATLFEAVSRLGPSQNVRGWRYWLDELFLHPQWGLLGSLAVFALVLFVVFEGSVFLDSITAAKLIELSANWQPQSTTGVIARAVSDGLIGLTGIVVPYMIPLVLLLVWLEKAGVMQRIAFVVDRGFHRIGLHGGAALPFLLGLGCNVPAISGAAAVATGRDRVVASLLITFVPCSARSAIILAIGAKYLGGLGVFAIFMLSIIVIAVLGRVLTRRYPETGPGQLIEIPQYALPDIKTLISQTWMRTSDILTIVTPLLVGGSVVLALLSHIGADDFINTLFTPVTSWWLGLPVVLGVPVLFGVLRKELSLLMIYQALGTFEIGNHLDNIQIMTFLIFLTFYVPCISTFAVMIKTIGRREAFFSIALSVTAALLISGVVRWTLEVFSWIQI